MLWFTDKDENQALSLRYTGDVLFDEKSPYQSVRVFDTHSYGKMLAIGNMVMCTERDEFHYHEMIVHQALQLLKTPKKVLVIGGGDGGTIRVVLRYPSIEKVVMVEIDEVVVRASKQFLPTIASEFSNPKLDLKIGDGIAYLASAAPESFDAIIVDGSDPVGPAKGLFTSEFYKNCNRALRTNGVLVTQGESPMFRHMTFVELNQCLKGIFGAKQTHTLLFHAPTYPSGMWSLQLCTKTQMHPKTDVDTSAVQAFSKKQGLRYYNEEVHMAAFSLPTFVRTMLGEI
jgi:spermidine synthase